MCTQLNPKISTLLSPLYTKEGETAFTLTEMMVAVSFSVLLLIAVYGFYNASSQSYFSGISGQTLQDGANIVLSKIIQGGKDSVSGKIYRLSTAASFYVPNGNSSEIYFCQDSPCTPADSTARYYTLDPLGTSIRYYHPTTNPLGYDIIYTAPTGTSLKIRFQPGTEINPTPPPALLTLPNVIEIDVDLAENLSPGITNGRLTTTSGDISTFVLLRNHS